MKKIVLVSGILSALVLAACGGGGGGSSDSGSSSSSSSSGGTVGTAEGMWTGKTNTNRTITGFVLSDNSYYIMYSAIGNASRVSGFIQGGGNSNNGSFTSTNARDFNIDGIGVSSASVSASYTAKTAYNGNISYNSGTVVSFTSTYLSDYDSPPALSTVAGSFAGTLALAKSAQAETATVTINSNGTFTARGNNSGCQGNGTITPRARGNVFDVSLTFGVQSCLYPNQTVAGIATYTPATRILYVGLPTSDRTDAVLYTGSK